MNDKVKLTRDAANQLSRRTMLKLFGGAGIAAASGFVGANFTTASAQTHNAQISNQTNANPQGAGFYKFKIGALECVLVSDGTFGIPPVPLFAANAPKTEAENLLRENFLPTTASTVHVNTLVVKTANKTVLIDTGTGDTGGADAGLLKANLLRAGIAPETITDVLFTHAHTDHAGGVVGADGKLNFANARYHIAQIEWETWTGKNVNLGKTQVDAATAKSFIETMQRKLSSLKDRISLFKPNQEIVTGVTAVKASGHTPGHTAFLIASNGESVLHAGDFAHHFIFQLQHPEWHTAFDFEPQEAIATRKRLLDRAAADRTLVVGSHMPFPGVGHIRVRDARRTSFEWVPIVWQWQA